MLQSLLYYGILVILSIALAAFGWLIGGTLKKRKKAKK